jgi:catechol 2,3-dioxygenase
MTVEAGRSDGLAKRSLSIECVTLVVHALDGVADFYERTVGLHRLRADGETVLLGVGDTVLVELRRDVSARSRSPNEAGLFHTAFLLPTRADLARWTLQALEAHAPIVGASDHDVSEALYLSDPEGNGIEIYADRPASAWRWNAGLVEMGTKPLDLENLFASMDRERWAGFPEGSTIGHVHLQVGALEPAEAFYAGVLGLDITCRYPGAIFYSADGYHHHLATNIWNSRGAGERRFPSTGLADVQIRIDPTRAAAIRERAGLTEDAAARFTLNDPWGTSIAMSEIVRPKMASREDGVD